MDELEIWLVRVKDDDDEELADRDMADLVPRLGVAWCAALAPARISLGNFIRTAQARLV